MGVTQGQVSKIEHTDNDKFNVEMLERYVDAIEHQIIFDICPKMDATGWVCKDQGDHSRHKAPTVFNGCPEAAKRTPVFFSHRPHV